MKGLTSNTWGKAIVEKLAQDLQKEYSGMSGFSARNIWRMRDFYLSYKDSQKLPPMVAEIAWTQNIVIMEKCKDDLEREFYISMTRQFGWIKDVLIHQIENQSYENTLLNKNNFSKRFPKKSATRPSIAKLSKKTRLNRESLYKMLSKKETRRCIASIMFFTLWG